MKKKVASRFMIESVLFTDKTANQAKLVRKSLRVNEMTGGTTT